MAKKSPKLNKEKLEQLAPEFFQLLIQESDMPRVLIAVGYLDQWVASILSKFFVSGETSNAILSDRGMLGSFSARTDLAYCLGLIPKEMYQNLRKVGEIRNRFAHHHLTLTFEDAAAAKLCDDLVFYLP